MTIVWKSLQTAGFLLIIIGGFEAATGNEFSPGDAESIPRWYGLAEVAVGLVMVALSAAVCKWDERRQARKRDQRWAEKRGAV